MNTMYRELDSAERAGGRNALSLSMTELAAGMLRHAVALTRCFGVTRSEAETIVRQGHDAAPLGDVKTCLAEAKSSLAAMSDLNNGGTFTYADLPPSVRDVIEIARSITFWEQRGEGMVVSAFHVREMWSALNRMEALLQDTRS